MTLSDFALYLVIGKVFIFFIQKFPVKKIIDKEFLNELIGCQLCLGFWIYTGLAFLFWIDPFNVRMPYIAQIFTGSVSSLIMFLLSSGWKAEFATIWLENK